MTTDTQPAQRIIDRDIEFYTNCRDAAIVALGRCTPAQEPRIRAAITAANAVVIALIAYRETP